MRYHFFLLIMAVLLLVPVLAYAEGSDGCSPEFTVLAEKALVELHGTGDMDIVVITDPLCWHCRLGHKLLSEYPDKYRTVKLLFFPRLSFIGSDMAAWILEDAAGTDKLKAMVDYAYSDLKQPKTEDLAEARMIVLAQFVLVFPEIVAGTTMPELSVRLERDHRKHVEEGAALADAAELPGTPILIAGKIVLKGYGAGAWLKALDKKDICE